MLPVLLVMDEAGSAPTVAALDASAMAAAASPLVDES